MEQHRDFFAVLLSFLLIYWFTPPTINGIYTIKTSLIMELIQ